MFDEKKIEKANLTAMRELLGEPTNPKKGSTTKIPPISPLVDAFFV